MRHSSAAFVALLGGWLLVAVAAPWAEGSARAIELEQMFAPPSASAWLGRDDLGRSLAARIAVGARASLTIALAVTLVTAVIGILVGILAGWYGGLVDMLVVRAVDVFLAFPGLLLAIALSAMLGPGLDNLVIALAVVGWVGFARLARTQTLSLRRRDHVLVARALGTPVARILRVHVLPLIAGPLMVEATFTLALVIVAEAGLSFLGLGVQPPTPSWGSLIRDGARYLLIAPHMVVMPSLALMSAVVAVNVLGDRMRDRWQSAV